MGPAHSAAPDAMGEGAVFLVLWAAVLLQTSPGISVTPQPSQCTSCLPTPPTIPQLDIILPALLPGGAEGVTNEPTQISTQYSQRHRVAAHTHSPHFGPCPCPP